MARMRIVTLTLISILVSSCLFVDNKVRGSFPSNTPPATPAPAGPIEKAMTVGKAEFENVSYQGFRIRFPFTGDENDNSVATLYYCSIKSQPGCNPFTGSSVVLEKSGTYLVADIVVATSVAESGGALRYRILTTDEDGLEGGVGQGFKLIPSDPFMPQALAQFGALFQGTEVFTSAELGDEIRSSTIDEFGNVYFMGFTVGNLGEINGGEWDAFVVKVNSSGGLDPNFGNYGILQLGAITLPSSSDVEDPYKIIYDDGSLYIGGFTFSNLGGTNASDRSSLTGQFGDAFIVKIDSTYGFLDPDFGDGDGTDNDGVLQINNINATGANFEERVSDLAFDGANHLYILGRTSGNPFGLGGGASAGDDDLFVAKVHKDSGLLDLAFGDGDGNDGDGITVLNGTNTNDFTGYETPTGIVYYNGFVLLLAAELGQMYRLRNADE